jgi:hypothetical protein
MTEEIRNKLAKVYALVKQGATEGEQQAARKALDRIIERYKIDPADLDQVDLKEYRFKYSTKLEFWLFQRLVSFFTPDALEGARYSTFGVREFILKMNYMDWVTLESSYEYFRRHMKLQWQKVCAKEVKRCRKTKNRNKRKAQLQEEFLQLYLIASRLYNEKELCARDLSKMTNKQLNDLRKMQGIEGGQYNRQMTNGLLLN